jgi:hypothetical protein
MTVKELQARLATFPEDWPIVVFYGGEEGYTHVDVGAMAIAVAPATHRQRWEGDLCLAPPGTPPNAVLIA